MLLDDRLRLRGGQRLGEQVSLAVVAVQGDGLRQLLRRLDAVCGEQLIQVPAESPAPPAPPRYNAGLALRTTTP